MDVHGRDLRYFVAVAEELHFTRAAERLFVSQPALSKQVRALERQLGAELLVRDRHGVALTAAGAALLPHARAVLAAWEQAAQAVEAAKAAQRATLVVGMSTSPGRGGLLPAVRSRFAAAHPEASLRLRHVGWQDPTAGLADGTSDVAFVWLPLPDEHRYGYAVVAEEPRLVAFPDGHRLAAADPSEPVDFAALLDEPFLALPPSAGPLRDYWLALEARGGHPARVGAEIASNEETYEALVAGLGVVLLAAGNAPLITLGGVRTRPVRGISPSRFAVAWPRGKAGPLVRAYVTAARLATGTTPGDHDEPPGGP
ncbi:LysR family transcriptional regulator [Actinacidiphila guanduensis]|uniref:DNA-binding transcriptional regulator, LysR family n=1 Tax=Actinacidiphila guanduensis TaxID=310781 RepID=A0A1H0A833_9ACTN|nr:LysR family transcriptional regulator [Actinacidiphila guanduensis]SDN29635.1 DNA-binding transcriptional regulator, LysR family [Actinacidiphila guanduensis]